MALQLPQIYSASTQTPLRGSNGRESKGRCWVRSSTPKIQATIRICCSSSDEETFARRVWNDIRTSFPKSGPRGSGACASILSTISKELKTKKTIGGGYEEGGLYHFDELSFCSIACQVVASPFEVHYRLGHPSLDNSSTFQFELPQMRSWQLHIEDRLPSKLFTGNRIESKNGTPVKIVIREAISETIITSGSLSSLKVEILVLDGDFGADDLDNWTEKDFSAKILHAREGKRPLLAGTVIISLRNGVGYVTDIFFTDNSRWVRSGKFRLGVRSVQSTPTEARIREARSDAFVVKDQRGEVYKKHYPPNLGDEVWRLEKIRKEGVFHRRLADKGITTVQDLLQLYNVEPTSLRDAMGGRISSKREKTIIEHANTCALDNKFFVYYGYGFGIVFNSIFKVVAGTFDGVNAVPLNELDGVQMGFVDILKKSAYENKNDLFLLDQLSPLGSNVLQLSLLHEPSSSYYVQNVNSAGVQQAGDAAPL